jgi:hypothetical protein
LAEEEVLVVAGLAEEADQDQADSEEVEAEREVLVMVEEDQEVSRRETVLVEVEILEREDLLRCMKLHAINAIKFVKFHSNQQAVSLSIAALALNKREIQVQEEIQINLLECQKSSLQR